MTMRIVIVGSDGFVGSNLTEYLMDRDYDVACPTLEELDVTDDKTCVDYVQSDDVVVNASGYANATDTSSAGRRLFQSINVDGVENLARACVRKSVHQLIHISSVAAMGRLYGKNIGEDARGPAISPYAISKRDAETLLEKYKHDLNVTILRPTSVFGEGRGLAAAFCQMIEHGSIILPRGGRALIPFTYIGNVCECVRLAIGNEACYNETFITGDKTSYPLREIVDNLASGMGVNVKIRPVPYSASYIAAILFEMKSLFTGSPPALDRRRLATLSFSAEYDISKFRDKTGYTQPYLLQEACTSIAKWYIAQSNSGLDNAPNDK